MPSKSSTQLGSVIVYVSCPAQLPKTGTLALTYLLAEKEGQKLLGYRRGLPHKFCPNPKLHTPQEVKNMLGLGEIAQIWNAPEIHDGQMVVVNSKRSIQIVERQDRVFVQDIGQMPLEAI